MSFAIQKNQCDQCLFSKNKIVTDKRRKEIVKTCLAQDRYFTCHKATLKGRHDVCCRGFWDNFKHQINIGRMAQRIFGKDVPTVDIR